MQTIDQTFITIPTRQRKERPRGFLEKLKLSIVSKGLMHPVVLSVPSTWTESPVGSLPLVAGEGRLIVMKELHTDGVSFQCNGEPVPHGQIPYSRISDLSPADLAEAEFEENILRAALTWQEETEAKMLIHTLRKQQNPKQTLIATAREIVAVQHDGPAPENEVVAEREQLSKAIFVSQYLSNPKVRAAKTLNEASRVALDQLEAGFQANLLASNPTQSQHTLIKGDLLTVLPDMEGGSFDLIIADPPYGINADEYRTITKVAGERKHHEGHFYKDDLEHSTLICNTIFRQGFRLLRPRGLLFLFCDVDRFAQLREAAMMQGFSAWRTPLIWHKTGANAGFAPWGAGGFIRSYEMLLFLSKGRKTLSMPGGQDVLSFARVHHTDRVHAAEKPAGLLSRLIQLSCIPGDHILDPCCGSGVIFEAASACNVVATGIEIDPEFHAYSASRLLQTVDTTEEEDLPEDATAGLEE
jgi:site-specific DNA-methyltransferase (adenine-specific)